MKLYPTLHGLTRSYAAALRNCLSYHDAPVHCPIRKCRRDGFCSGPIICNGSRGRRLAINDAADIAPDDAFAPVCYQHVPDDVRASVESIFHSYCRDFRYWYSATTFETTRVIASRRWRRLRGVHG